MSSITVASVWFELKEPAATTPFGAARYVDLLPQNLLHLLPFCQFIDQFVEVANFLHQRLFDLFHVAHSHTTPLISARLGFMAGACAKKVLKSLPCVSCCCNPAWL